MKYVAKIADIGADAYRSSPNVCFRKPSDLPMLAALNSIVDKVLRKHGGYAAIEVKEPFRPRSTGPKSQNHRLNGFVSQFCEATGNDFDDIKLHVKRRAMRRGLPPKQNERGEILYSRVDGDPLPMSERDMSVEQCGWVIAEIEQLAAEEGITLVEEG